MKADTYTCSICLMRHAQSDQCEFTKGLNLTPKRLQALQVVSACKEGCYVSHIADKVLTSEYRRKNNTGFWAQQATRSGAGYVIPMIKAGLLRKWRTEHGWGRVTLTDAGRKVLSDIDAANDPANQPLDAVLERCIMPAAPETAGKPPTI